MISFWIFFGLRRSILKCESASPQDPSQPRSYCLCLWSWNEALWLYIGLSLVFCRWCKQFSLKILTYLYKVRSGNFEVHRKHFTSHSKKYLKVVSPTRSPRQQWPPRRKKNGDLSIVFSVQGTGGSPTGPDAENRVGYQEAGSPGRPVFSGLQVPCEPGHCRARIRSPWWPSRGVFPSKCP